MLKKAKAKLINTVSYTNICNPISTARVQNIQLFTQRLLILYSDGNYSKRKEKKGK